MLASCRHELRSCLWDLRTRTFEVLSEAIYIRAPLMANPGLAQGRNE